MTARLALLFLIACVFGCVGAHAAESVSEAAAPPYTNAFRALVAGEWGAAYDGLSHVRDAYPDSVYAERARDHMLRLDRLGLSERRALDQSGRAETIGFGVIYGAWAGLATTLLVDEDDDEKSAAAGMMLGAPIALFSALALTRGRTITRGQASLIRLGGYFGTWQGVGLTLLGDGRRSDNATLTGALVGGLAGIGVASLVGAATEPTTGEAALTSYGALWGTWLSFAATQVLSVDNDDATLATTLAGGVAGLASMALIAPHTDMREGRANLINLGGIAGTIMAGGLLLITQPDSGEAALATLMAGGVGGLYLATNATTGYGRSTPARVQGRRP